ncbi:MAG: hypothetical protein AAGD86_14435 [Pseudomonadota bacterium]
MTAFYRRLLALTLVALAFLAQSALADTFYDYAEVLSATPVTRTVYGAGEREVCRTEHGANAIAPGRAVPDGVARSGEGYSLAEVLRRDLARASATAPASARRVCRVETVHEPRRETVGYRVEYRYGNRTYTRTVPEHPGEHLRVRVDIRR